MFSLLIHIFACSEQCSHITLILSLELTINVQHCPTLLKPMHTITDLSGYPAKHWYFVITEILSYRYTENIQICLVFLEWSVNKIRITTYELHDGLKKVIQKCIKIPTFYDNYGQPIKRNSEKFCESAGNGLHASDPPFRS
jgi:hypothetical protein